MFTFNIQRINVMKPSNYKRIEVVTNPFSNENEYVFEGKMYTDWFELKSLVEQEELTGTEWELMV